MYYSSEIWHYDYYTHISTMIIITTSIIIFATILAVLTDITRMRVSENHESFYKKIAVEKLGHEKITGA